jgi:predicted dienelactone hydrolase
MTAGIRLVALASVLIGCSSEPSDDDPRMSAADMPGPHHVGVTTIEASSEGRTLPIELWYPAKASNSEPVSYPVLLGPLKLTEIPSPLGAVRDAPLELRGAPHPVLLFSHGSGGMRTQSVYLTEHLASHGFVVAAPDHVGNTLAEEVNQSGLSLAEAARIRPLDISHTLDALLERSASDPLLAGAADPDRVGVAGHSFGGYTALRLAGATVDVEALIAECSASAAMLCAGWQDVTEFPESARDARVIAALPQAPGGALAMNAGGNDGFAAVQIPTMIQGGMTDDTTPFESEARVPFQRLSGPAFLVGIANAGHFTFSNGCEILERGGLAIERLSDGCKPGDIPWPDAHRLLNGFATEFLRVHVQGRSELADRLEPKQPPAPNVAVHEARTP